jgi:hypothetical protein
MEISCHANACQRLPVGDLIGVQEAKNATKSDKQGKKDKTCRDVAIFFWLLI